MGRTEDYPAGPTRTDTQAQGWASPQNRQVSQATALGLYFTIPRLSWCPQLPFHVSETNSPSYRQSLTTSWLFSAPNCTRPLRPGLWGRDSRCACRSGGVAAIPRGSHRSKAKGDQKTRPRPAKKQREAGRPSPPRLSIFRESREDVSTPQEADGSPARVSHGPGVYGAEHGTSERGRLSGT